ncbi:unnamed protein product [Lota lota]
MAKTVKMTALSQVQRPHQVSFPDTDERRCLEAGFQQLVREQEARQPHTSEQGSHRRTALFQLVLCSVWIPSCLSVWNGLFGVTREGEGVVLGREDLRRCRGEALMWERTEAVEPGQNPVFTLSSASFSPP